MISALALNESLLARGVESEVLALDARPSQGHTVCTLSQTQICLKGPHDAQEHPLQLGQVPLPLVVNFMKHTLQSPVVRSLAHVTALLEAQFALQEPSAMKSAAACIHFSEPVMIAVTA